MDPTGSFGSGFFRWATSSFTAEMYAITPIANVKSAQKSSRRLSTHFHTIISSKDNVLSIDLNHFYSLVHLLLSTLSWLNKFNSVSTRRHFSQRLTAHLLMYGLIVNKYELEFLGGDSQVNKFEKI